MIPTSKVVPLLCIVFVVAAAQRDDFPVPDWAKGKFFWIASDGPMAKHLSEFPDYVGNNFRIQNFLAHTESQILFNLNAGGAPNATQLFQPCNIFRKKPFSDSWRSFFGLRGFPEPDLACVTQIDETTLFSDQKPLYTIDELYNAIFQRAQTVSAQSRAIADALIPNWGIPTAHFNFPYNRGSQRCVIHPAGGVRFRNKWYIFSILTNAPMIDNLPDYARQYLSEFHHVLSDGKMDKPLLQIIPKRSSVEGQNDTKVYNTTTTLTTFRGQALAASLSTIYPEKVPALQSALDKSLLYVQQADDATTPSSLALLILPLILNVIPIALLTSVTAKVMILYTVITDIVTVIPLTIKGIELISIGSSTHRSIAVVLSGAGNGSMSISAGAEIWAAQCRSKGNVLPAGIAFLVLSIVFMVVGVLAEFYARYYVMKRSKALEYDVPLMSLTFDEDLTLPISLSRLKRADRNIGASAMRS